MENILDVVNVSFGYNGKPVLNNINLDVKNGDFLGIVGPNGSGKSTLLKLTLGMLKPQRGQIKIFGEDINRFHGWGQIGYVSQKVHQLNPSFPATVYEVVKANLFSKVGLFKPVGRHHSGEVDRVLNLVGLSEHKDTLIGHLSGGQLQRALIARAMVGEPKLLILDEPTVGLDITSLKNLNSILRRLNRELGLTIIMVTHDLYSIGDLANKIACLKNKSIFVHDSKNYSSAEDFWKQVYACDRHPHYHCHDLSNI